MSLVIPEAVVSSGQDAYLRDRTHIPRVSSMVQTPKGFAEADTFVTACLTLPTVLSPHDKPDFSVQEKKKLFAGVG